MSVQWDEVLSTLAPGAVVALRLPEPNHGVDPWYYMILSVSQDDIVALVLHAYMYDVIKKNRMISMRKYLDDLHPDLVLERVF